MVGVEDHWVGLLAKRASVSIFAKLGPISLSWFVESWLRFIFIPLTDLSNADESSPGADV